MLAYVPLQPVPLRFQRVCAVLAGPFWQGRQQSIVFSRTIARCLSNAAFTLLFLGNKTPRFFFSRTSLHGFLISSCISTIAERENPSLAILAIFKARHVSDYSSCTRPSCLATVADMLKTYKKLVAASRVRIGCYLNHIRLRSLLKGLWGLFRPFPGTFITKLVCMDPRIEHIMMFTFADCADKCLGRPWRFPITGRDELVM